MEKIHSFFKFQRTRAGSAIVGLIIVIVLVVIVFSVKRYLASTNKDPNVEGIMPWKEWKIRHKDQSENTLTQPEIPGEFKSFDGNVRLAGGKDGRAEIGINISGGSVTGRWYGSYFKSRDVSVDIISSNFAGEFHADRKYIDENGQEDPSKHYFLAKGNFLAQQTKKSSVKNMAGDIYVRGWYDGEKIITGEVHITSNEKYFENFEYSCRFVKPKPIMNQLF